MNHIQDDRRSVLSECRGRLKFKIEGNRRIEKESNGEDCVFRQRSHRRTVNRGEKFLYLFYFILFLYKIVAKTKVREKPPNWEAEAPCPLDPGLPYIVLMSH
jgi:hypothetical protein